MYSESMIYEGGYLSILKESGALFIVFKSLSAGQLYSSSLNEPLSLNFKLFAAENSVAHQTMGFVKCGRPT